VEENSFLYVRSIPRSRKIRFKAACITRGLDMRAVTEALMALFSDRPEVVDPYIRPKEGR
jgi:hypothetical protein